MFEGLTSADEVNIEPTFATSSDIWYEFDGIDDYMNITGNYVY